MSKKYVLHPGEVQSQSDGDIHYISYAQLINLYQLNPAECILSDPKGEWMHGLTSEFIAGLTHLYPRYDGNYTLEED